MIYLWRDADPWETKNFDKEANRASFKSDMTQQGANLCLHVHSSLQMYQQQFEKQKVIDGISVCTVGMKINSEAQ
jgi:hypothetical protein